MSASVMWSVHLSPLFAYLSTLASEMLMVLMVKDISVSYVERASVTFFCILKHLATLASEPVLMPRMIVRGLI